MAGCGASAGESESSLLVELTEDDIPGAKLSKPFQKYTVAQLRWWLICRGIKPLTSWKKQPPFMEGRSQLPAEEIGEGRKIASLRIHVERAIGRIKRYKYLQDTIPISMARLTNQIVCICAYLANFHVALVPQSESMTDEDVESYLNTLPDESDYNGDDESSSGIDED